MSWETTGTVTVTNNSATVTGSGTLFTVKSRVGDAFIGPDGALYEIVNIVSNTVLSISPTYKGVTGSAKAYKIAPVRGYQKLSADRLYTIANTIGDAVEVVTDLPAWLKAKQPTPVSAGGTGAETQLAARQNLGLKGAAVLDIGNAAGTVAAGDDARLTDSREWTAGTIPQAEVEAGTATTRRAFTSQRLRQGITAWFTGISGAIGRTILGRSTAAEVRGDLELGTAATKDVGTSAGQVMEVGAFGLGQQTLATISSAELNGKGLIAARLDPTDPLNVYSSGGVVAIHAGATGNFGGGIIFDMNTDSRAYIYSVRLGIQSSPFMLYATNNLLNIGTTAATARSALELGYAATATTIGTGTEILRVGAGGWMGRAGSQSTPYGYPSSLSDESNQTKVIRSEVDDNGVRASATGIHFAAQGTWGRLRVFFNTPEAWIQAGAAGAGTGWTSQVVLSDNLLTTTGTSTTFPMSQKATSDQLATKADTSTQVIAGTGLTGGGNLSANRTLNVSYGTTAGTSAQGNDSRVVNALQKSNNLSDINNSTSARSNLGLGTAATKDVGTSAGQVMEVGAFGLGQQTLATISSAELNGKGLIAARLDPTDPLNPTSNGIAAFHSGQSATYGGGILVTFTSAQAYIYSLHSGNQTGPFMLYTTNNTTKTPDGTLKASSPVINLYTDNHVLHNEEQFGAATTVTRKSKGVYEITGTLGLRSEGWYLDTPSDRNGNKYFNIEWTQNITPDAVDGVVDEYRDDIVVTIETFERVWNKETGLFENGAPIDINDLQDRFVQLRFNELKVEHEELDDDSN